MYREDMRRGDMRKSGEFKGYRSDYFLNGLYVLSREEKEELLKYAYFVEETYWWDGDRCCDHDYNMYFDTGKNSSLIIYSKGRFSQQFKVKLYDQVFESKEILGKKIDYTYLREVVMLLDYCATKLTKISEQEGFDKANNSELNKLMKQLKGYLKDAISGKEPSRLDVDFKQVVGEQTYTELQNECKVRPLKTACIAEGRIPPESDKIKYPENYDQLCLLLPEIEKVYEELFKKEENIKWEKPYNINLLKLKEKLSVERSKLKDLKRKIKDKDTYRNKNEGEKLEIKRGLLKDCIITEEEIKIYKIKINQRATFQKLRLLRERSIEFEKAQANIKIQNILSGNLWVDFEK